VSALSAYEMLEDRFRRHGLLSEALGVLHWDMSVMMPPGGAPARTEQLSVLQVMAHELLTDPRMSDLLDAAEVAVGSLNRWQAANVREMRARWLHATAVPADLVEARTRAIMECEFVWRDARPNADFATVAPLLERVLGLTRQMGEAKAAALGVSLYDALLDEFEPGGRSSAIDPVFDDYAAFLPDFLDRVMAAQDAAPAPRPIKGPFPVKVQREIGRTFAQKVGFDFDEGRLDESRHPFSSGNAGDLRITTRYDDTEFAMALMAVLHETGHAMYESNLPRDWQHQPVGQARGMALHESQSLIVEMQSGRSRDFIVWAAPVIQKAFGGKGAAWKAENLYRLLTRVEPSFIRVDADEVTYPAHVILRYRLEQAMLDGALAVSELPGAWNDELERLLGIRPPDDRLGCLQDIHWYDGAWGYFPTYTLGAMAAAQLMQAAESAVPALRPALAAGDFSPLMDWLKENVHQKASRATTQEILQEATGRPLDPSAFKSHLQSRYLESA